MRCWSRHRFDPFPYSRTGAGASGERLEWENTLAAFLLAGGLYCGKVSFECRGYLLDQRGECNVRLCCVVTVTYLHPTRSRPRRLPLLRCAVEQRSLEAAAHGDS